MKYPLKVTLAAVSVAAMTAAAIPAQAFPAAQISPATRAVTQTSASGNDALLHKVRDGRGAAFGLGLAAGAIGGALLADRDRGYYDGGYAYRYGYGPRYGYYESAPRSHYYHPRHFAPRNQYNRDLGNSHWRRF